MLSIILGKIPAGVIFIPEGFNSEQKVLPEKISALMLNNSGDQLVPINVFKSFIDNPIEIKISGLVEKPYRDHILFAHPENKAEERISLEKNLLSIALLGVFKNPERFDQLLEKKDPGANLLGYLLFPKTKTRTNVSLTRQNNGKIPTFCLDPQLAI